MLATEQDTDMHILGSGCTTYPWYVKQSKNDKVNYAADRTALDGWSIDMTMWDGDHDDDDHLVVVRINHDRLIDAMRRIADDGSVKGVSTECESECGNFLRDPETADFDACSADQVLQVLAYGKVIYG